MILLREILAKFYEAIIIILLALLVITSIGWGVEHYLSNQKDATVQEYKQKYTDLETDYKVARLTAERNKAQAEAYFAAKLRTITEQKDAEIKNILADTRHSTDVIERVYHYTDTATKLVPNSTTESVVNYTGALSDVFKECQSRLVEMGETADRHAIDSEYLQEIIKGYREVIDEFNKRLQPVNEKQTE